MEQAPARGTGARTRRRLIRHAWAADRSIFSYFVPHLVCDSVYPFLAVALPKLLLTELTRPAPSARTLLLIVGGFLALAGLFGFLKTYLQYASYPRLSRLRLGYICQTAEKLLTMGYRHTEDATFYDRYDRALQSTNSNYNGVELVYHRLFELPPAAVTMLALAAFIGTLSPVILLALALNVAAAALAARAEHRFRYKNRERLNRLDRRMGYYQSVSQDFAAGKDVRLYGLRERILDNYRTAIRAYVSVWRLIQNRAFLYSMPVLATLLLSDACTYGVLVSRAANGMPIADFSMYLTASASLSLLAKRFFEQLAEMRAEQQYVTDLFEFLDTDHGERGGTRAALPDRAPGIEFDDVSFTYPGAAKPVLSHFSFTVEPGERLALVGVNGAGKSTLVKLMTGLFDVTAGEIRIDNTPVSDYQKQALWSMFAAVFQEVNVPAFTVAENVACTAEGVDEARVQDALVRAGLWARVEQMPGGMHQMLHKVIEPDGAELSGGESQKLTIARALFRSDARIVVLDEPTAALDALAEAAIYEDFAALTQGKTAVYISHRLASTKFCDRILLLDENGVCECGTHEQLMRMGGKYCEMFTVQGKYYREEGADHAC